MADIKKEQEREELHRAIWAISDDLRGCHLHHGDEERQIRQ